MRFTARHIIDCFVSSAINDVPNHGILYEEIKDTINDSEAFGYGVDGLSWSLTRVYVSRIKDAPKQ